jgi:hypothetical protein
VEGLRTRTLISSAAAGVVGGYSAAPYTVGIAGGLSQYPLSTHLRAFFGHLAYRATVAVAAEILMWA